MSGSKYCVVHIRWTALLLALFSFHGMAEDSTTQSEDASTCLFRRSLDSQQCSDLDVVHGPFDAESCQQTCCDAAASAESCDVWNWDAGNKVCFHGGPGSHNCTEAQNFTGGMGHHIIGESSALCSSSGVCPTSRMRVKNCEWLAGNDGKQHLICPSDRSAAGYLGEGVQAMPGYNWWYDPGQANSLHFYDLDTIYDATYHGEDHVPERVVGNYSFYALAYCKHLLGRECAEVVDVGAGRCYFSEGMRKLGARVLSVEGTAAGSAACVHRAGPESVIRRDLRIPLDLATRFDLATCSEVAEHIEPPFAGTLVRSLTQLADVVWFSSEGPRWDRDSINNDDHVHHSNEQPDIFWDRLFAFFGFLPIALPAHVVAAVENRGRVLYYRSAAVPFDRSALTPSPAAREEGAGDGGQPALGVRPGELHLPFEAPLT